MPPTNPYMYPAGGQIIGTTHLHPKKSAVPLTSLMSRITTRVQDNMARTLVAHGYHLPTPEALGAAVVMEQEDRKELDATALHYTFPVGPGPGVQVALIDAYWNRVYVTPDTVLTDRFDWAADPQATIPTHSPPADMALWLDLHTGHWCAFSRDQSLGGPLGDGYMHQSPANRHPQPGGTP